MYIMFISNKYNTWDIYNYVKNEGVWSQMIKY